MRDIVKILFLKYYKFITVTLAILAIAVTLSLNFLNKETRVFAYEIISSNQIVSINRLIPRDDASWLYKKDSPIDKLSFYYEDKPIKAPYYTLIRIKNYGNSPIKSNDFESPIEIEFPGNVKIYECSILDSEPRNLKTKATYNSNKASIAPMLFNPGDFVTIGILTSEINGEPQIFARIIGIKSIEKRIFKKNKFIFSGILSMFFCLFFVYAALTLYSLTTDEPKALSTKESKLIYVVLLISAGTSFADGLDYLIPFGTSFKTLTIFIAPAILLLLIFIAIFFRMKGISLNKNKE